MRAGAAYHDGDTYACGPWKIASDSVPCACRQWGFARAKWPISVPCGAPSGTCSSGRCDTWSSPAAGVTSVANG